MKVELSGMEVKRGLAMVHSVRGQVSKNPHRCTYNKRKSEEVQARTGLVTMMQSVRS